MIAMSVDTSYIKSNILAVQKRIAAACTRSKRRPEAVTLVAVSKGVDITLIEAAYNAGLRQFGENRVQEGKEKIQKLSGLTGITWHLIGHLQSNKVKIAEELFQIIHSVDSIRLAETVSHLALRSDKGPVDFPILMQVNIAGEASKQGFSVSEVVPAFNTISGLPHIKIRGLMTIAPIVANPEEARPLFCILRQLRDELGVHELSMGMTDDFEVAIEEGATMVRIGRAIFGQANK